MITFLPKICETPIMERQLDTLFNKCYITQRKFFLFQDNFTNKCDNIQRVKKLLVILKGGRLLRGGETTFTVASSGHNAIMLSGGMMKRKIMKKLKMGEKKFALCMMLAGFAALNTGFTGQVNEIKAAEVAAVQEMSEPTAVSVGENGTIEISGENTESKELAEIVDNTRVENEQTSEENINVEYVEERPREDFVETSRGAVRYEDVMAMEATAYLPGDGNGDGITAIGVPATYGVVAVDPRVIPLGSRLYIPGYGEALAADTGGAINGYKIDLCMDSYSQAMQFGRRSVTVYVLK